MPPDAVQTFIRVYREKPRSSSPDYQISPSISSIDPDISTSSSSKGVPTSQSDLAEDLADLWHEALSQYKDITGIDLRDENSSLHKRFGDCSDPHAIVSVLDDLARELKEYRHPSSKGFAVSFRNTLRHIVRATLAVLDIGGEAATVAVPGGKAVFVAIGVLLRATEGMSERFDAAAALLEKFSFYMAHLEISMRAPLQGAPRAIVIEMLAHMLRTFAAVTNMMRRNRLKQFLSVLFNQENEVVNLTRRVETLLTEESRLTLAEALSAVRSIAVSLDDGPFFMQTMVVWKLKAHSTASEKVQSRFETSGILDMPALFEEWATQDRSDMDNLYAMSSKIPKLVNIMETTLHVIQGIETRMATIEGRTQRITKFTSCLLAPCSDFASFSRLIATLVHSFKDLPQKEQDSLKHGIAILFAIATATVSGGRTESNSDILITSLLHPGVVLASFLPMAAIYVSIFLFWKCFQTERSIPRSPGYANIDTIILLDVFGKSLVLQLDMCQSWEDIHTVLLRQFSGTMGIGYVRSRAYHIMDSESIIKPHTWAQKVRANLKLEMSIIIPGASRFVQCPWCGSPASQTGEDIRVECINCRRQYWASREAQKMTADSSDEDLIEIDSQPIINGAYPEAPQESSDAADTESKVGGAETRLIADLKEFRLITVMQSGKAALDEDEDEVSVTSGNEDTSGSDADMVEEDIDGDGEDYNSISAEDDASGQSQDGAGSLPVPHGDQLPEELTPTPRFGRLYSLHPVLAADLEAILSDERRIDNATLAADASRPGCIKLSIRGPGLLWECRVVADKNGRTVTVEDVLTSLTTFFKKSVARDDYQSLHGETREAVKRAFIQRTGHDEVLRSRGLTRRDFLQGDRIMALAPSDREELWQLVVI